MENDAYSAGPVDANVRRKLAMRHETKWTWVSGSGGVLRFSTREGAVSHALTFGGFAIYPPIYGD